MCGLGHALQNVPPQNTSVRMERARPVLERRLVQPRQPRVRWGFWPTVVCHVQLIQPQTTRVSVSTAIVVQQLVADAQAIITSAMVRAH